MSVLSPAAAGAAFRWMAVKTARPHCASAAASTGVLNVMYWMAGRCGVIGSFVFLSMEIQFWVAPMTAVAACCGS